MTVPECAKCLTCGTIITPESQEEPLKKAWICPNCGSMTSNPWWVFPPFADEIHDENRMNAFRKDLADCEALWQKWEKIRGKKRDEVNWNGL